MDLIINGPQKLKGDVTISGLKNAILPIMAAALLADSPVTLTNVPDIADVKKVLGMFDLLKITYKYNPNKATLVIDPTTIKAGDIRKAGLDTMRASLLYIPPLVLKLKKVTFDQQIGGCTLGTRQVDTFFGNLKKLGIKIERQDHSLIMSLKKSHAKQIWQDETSVTSTEAAAMIAALRPGKTTIKNAASEPHVQDTCLFLNKMGANITGIGTNTLVVEGTDKLHGTTHRIVDDYYELGTFLAISAVSGQAINIKHRYDPKSVSIIFEIFKKLGIEIETKKDAEVENQYISRITKADFKTDQPLVNSITKIQCAPWPGFPVDLLPIMVPLALKVDSAVLIHNWMYDSGLGWVSELRKNGARILQIGAHRAMTYGKSTLYGAEIEAPYIIRAAIAMMITAIMSKGKTTILNADSIKRAHHQFFKKLRKLGLKFEIRE